MNRMNEVANMLGIKLNEEFKIKGISDTYLITENGLITKESDYAQGLVLTQLITGQLEIQKYPWRPQRGDIYFYVTLDGDFEVRSDSWSNHNVDILGYKIGNCYRTYNDALSSIPFWKDFFENDRVLTYA